MTGLRSGSPRDHTDLSLSWAHIPNIVVYDFSSGIARQVNPRPPESGPYTPHEGGPAAPTTQNTGGANDVTTLTRPTEEKNPTGERSRPTSREQSSRDPGNGVPSRVDPVTGQSGGVDTRAVRRFFSQMRKCDYFLSRSSPSTNLFLLRNFLHHRNVRVNETTQEKCNSDPND